MKVATDYDLAVIGGGINGTGIAATAAVRGLKVILCEQNDLASATSSASSKLIHGGLRYLENYEFKLVAEALAEREILLNLGKHLVKPQAFILPYQPEMRPRFLIRLGLFIYDHLGGRSILPKTCSIRLGKHLAGKPLQPKFKYAFQYFDCKTEDSRLVIANAQKAKNHGATIATHTYCLNAKPLSSGWELSLLNKSNQTQSTITSKVLINATGPWADQFLQQQAKIKSSHELALVKGSHIIIPKFYEGDFAYLLQNSDKRVVFVIPYQQDFLLVGTTDIGYHDTEIAPRITHEEINYLSQTLFSYFKLPEKSLKIIHAFSGVRPLLNDKNANLSAITRGYLIDKTYDQPPLYTLFGGKLTTYRSLSEKMVELLEAYFPKMKAYQLTDFILPGSNYKTRDELLTQLHQIYPWLPSTLLDRYLGTYGSLTNKLLGDAKCLADLGIHFGHDLYQREIDYLIAEEWASTAEDILWRRTKLGLILSDEDVQALRGYLTKTLSHEGGE